MADDREAQFARTEALSDQRWAEFEEDLESLTRIGLHGPESDEDVKLARRACLLVMAEIHRRRSYRDPEELAAEGE